jgi:hypothetical protein
MGQFVAGRQQVKPRASSVVSPGEHLLKKGDPTLSPHRVGRVAMKAIRGKGQVDYYKLVVPKAVNGAVVTAVDTTDPVLDQVKLGSVDG